MALELIYTSVPRGLEPGRTGFCTVAMTRGISPQMVKILEGLVGYTPVFEHYDPNSAYNPPSIFHYPVSDGKNRYELLARVCACGVDYTKRSNKIGHFILLTEAEKALLASGPASLLDAPQLFISEWHGEPQYFANERVLNMQEVGSAKAEAWEQVTGDAGWAAWLADAYMANPDKPCFVVFDPLQIANLEVLVAESLMLLPENKRWQVTWNTYMTSLPVGLPSCNWRFCTADPAVMSAIGCVSGANILDLGQPLGAAGNSPLAQCARTGSDPYPKAVSTVQGRPTAPGAPAAPSQGDGALTAMLQKRLEEQKAKQGMTGPKKPTTLSAKQRLGQRKYISTANGGNLQDGVWPPKKQLGLPVMIAAGVALFLVGLILGCLLGNINKPVGFNIIGEETLPAGGKAKYMFVVCYKKGQIERVEPGSWNLNPEDETYAQVDETGKVTNKNNTGVSKTVTLKARYKGKEAPYSISLASKEKASNGKKDTPPKPPKEEQSAASAMKQPDKPQQEASILDFSKVKDSDIEISPNDKLTIEAGEKVDYSCKVTVNGKKEDASKYRNVVLEWSIHTDKNELVDSKLASVTNGKLENKNTSKQHIYCELRVMLKPREATNTQLEKVPSMTLKNMTLKKRVEKGYIVKGKDSIPSGKNSNAKYECHIKWSYGPDSPVDDVKLIEWTLNEKTNIEGGIVFNMNDSEEDKVVALTAKYDGKDSTPFEIILRGKELTSGEIKEKVSGNSERIYFFEGSWSYGKNSQVKTSNYGTLTWEVFEGNKRIERPTKEVTWSESDGNLTIANQTEQEKKLILKGIYSYKGKTMPAEKEITLQGKPPKTVADGGLPAPSGKKQKKVGQ